MKKHSLAEFFKSKSFYALLCVGTLAIVAIARVNLNQTSENGSNQNLVDLNEPISSDVANDYRSDADNQSSSTTANNEEGNSQTEVAQNIQDHLSEINGPVTDGSLLEFETVDDPKAIASDAKQKDTVVADVADTQEVATDNSLEDAQEVMKPETLHYEAETGLLWPVAGNILMNYSVDKVIYHETLEQFKINPAVLIDAEVGAKVCSAAKGIITSVVEQDEIGLTVTQSLGNGYTLVYGQLKDVVVKVGDVVEEGDKIGSVANPTKFYSLEGSNLYFQVFKDDETMNPMLLLR